LIFNDYIHTIKRVYNHILFGIITVNALIDWKLYYGQHFGIILKVMSTLLKWEAWIFIFRETFLRSCIWSWNAYESFVEVLSDFSSF